MTTTRRTVLLAGAAMGAASTSSAREAVRGRRRRLWIDAELVQDPSPADALVIPAGVFLDPALLGASPPGDYEARLTSANRFLLLDGLRHARIPHAVRDGAVLFRKPSAKTA
jgi:hypothetical protein